MEWIQEDKKGRPKQAPFFRSGWVGLRPDSALIRISRSSTVGIIDKTEPGPTWMYSCVGWPFSSTGMENTMYGIRMYVRGLRPPQAGQGPPDPNWVNSTSYFVSYILNGRERCVVARSSRPTRSVRPPTNHESNPELQYTYYYHTFK